MACSSLLGTENKPCVLQAGILTADKIITVSENYANEIQTPSGGWGLESLLALRGKGGGLAGVVNGIDTVEWNPATDPHLPFNYGLSNFSQVCWLHARNLLRFDDHNEVGMMRSIAPCYSGEGLVQGLPARGARAQKMPVPTTHRLYWAARRAEGH